jgi:hypothetical protein
VAVAFASEVLRIFRLGTERRDPGIFADESVEGRKLRA